MLFQKRLERPARQRPGGAVERPCEGHRARKLRVQRDLFLVGSLNGRAVATVMAGLEAHRGWINYLAVASDCRRQGIGLRMMEAAGTRPLFAILGLRWRTTATRGRSSELICPPCS